MKLAGSPIQSRSSGRIFTVLIGIILSMLAVLLVLLIYFPATWVADAVLEHSDGRVVLAHASGTVWQGEAMLGLSENGLNALNEVRDGRRKRLTGLVLPGLLKWKIDPFSVFSGKLQAELVHTEMMPAPVKMVIGLNEVMVEPGQIRLPAELLTGLGTPFNTFKPKGLVALNWDRLTLGQKIVPQGVLTANISQVSTALSPVSPLGDYTATFMLSSRTMNVQTRSGALLITGAGSWATGAFQFDGEAKAAAGYEPSLSSLLSLLGKRTTLDAVSLKF